MEKIIEVRNLKKSYGNLLAVKGIDFYVEKGKLFAFLGTNGAGKSTTIDTICTFLKQDSGEVMVGGYQLGKEDDAIRNQIGAVFQESLMDRSLSIEENLEIRGELYGLKGKELKATVRRAASITGITELLKRSYGKLSGGQRRRCDIARALLHTPSILFLDEPTTGLDPQTRKSVWETIKKLQKESELTVFLTTHYMEEAAEADYVLVIDSGEIVAKGSPAELKEEYASDKLVLQCKQTEEVKAILEHKKRRYKIKGKQITIPIEKTMEAIPLLEDCKEWILDFEVNCGSMDEVFIGITGKDIRE